MADHLPSGPLFETLTHLGLTTPATVEVFSRGTRDNPDVTVWRDRLGGVIFISDHYVGESVYRLGHYREELVQEWVTASPDSQDRCDTERRIKTLRPWILNRDVLDFGCGRGSFLRAAAAIASTVTGVELQESAREALTRDRITCVADVAGLPPTKLYDAIFAFHVVEHLVDPISVLDQLRRQLRQGGRIFVEVPSAGDALLGLYHSEAFKQFTLCSQHLLLHTSDSISRTMGAAGFHEVCVQQIQRYPLSNHLAWLVEGRPSGHGSRFAIIDNSSLQHEYAHALARIGAADTLMAVATN